jgi:hypothetical protein
MPGPDGGARLVAGGDCTPGTGAGGDGAGLSLKNCAGAVFDHTTATAIVQSATYRDSARLRPPQRAMLHADGDWPVPGSETPVMGPVLDRKRGKFKP